MDPSLTRPLIPFLAYALIVIAGITYAHDPARTVDAVKNLTLSTMLVATIVVLVTSHRALLVAAWAVVTTAMFLSAINLFQYFTADFEHTYLGLAQSFPIPTGGYQIGGPFGDPNYLSQRMVVALPIAVWLYRVSTPWILRLCAGVTSIACGAIVIVSDSRGGLIALLLVVIMLVGSTQRRRGVIGLALLLAFTLALLPARSRETIRSIQDSAVSLFSPGPEATGRSREWTVALAMYGDHPAAGVGANNFPARYLEYAADTGADLRPQERTPHSILLEIAAETGLVGLIAFGFLVLAAFDLIRQARKRFREKPSGGLIEGFRIGLASYLASGLFLGLTYPKLLWVLLAMAFACAQLPATPTGASHQARLPA